MITHNNRLRIGITISNRGGNQSIWENGISQNCIFLAMLLRKSDVVVEAALVTAGIPESASKDMMIGMTGVRLIGLEEAMSSLDILIEMGAQLTDEWAADFRKRGGRYVGMRVGNDYVIDAERAIFDQPHSSLVTAKTYDALWTIPGHELSCSDYFSITTRQRVTVVPHLWSPIFFQNGIDSLPSDISYGYRAGSSHWRVCCFEPNINLVKTCVVPMLISEEAYRIEPRFPEFFRFTNTHHVIEQPFFKQFANSLDIVTHGLATFEARFSVFDFLARYGDCVISHQWACPQNYLYYEVLYGKYPLIHNSELLKGYGYYYPDFDSQEGGKVLVEAYRNHDKHLEAYESSCEKLIRSLDIDNPVNIKSYTRELLNIGREQNSGEVATVSGIVDRGASPHPLPTGIDKAWLINLTRRPDRITSFKEAHPDLMLEIERHPAFDGLKLELTPKIARLFSHNEFQWKKAVMGCALSHLDLWTRLAGEPCGASWLILEDDSRLLPAWRSEWEMGLSGGGIPTDWDIVYLGGVLPPNRAAFEKCVEKLNSHVGQVGKNSAFGQNPPDRRFHFCTYAYVISSRGARKIMETLQARGGIWTAVDIMLCDAAPPLNVLFLHPLAASCTQEQDPSYVSGAFHDITGTQTFDSDLWNNREFFTEAEISSQLHRDDIIDILGALHDARRAT